MRLTITGLLLFALFSKSLCGGFLRRSGAPLLVPRTPLGAVDTTQSPFHFSLDCPISLDCTAVRKTIYNSLERLKRVVDLAAPIVTAFSFNPKCATSEKSSGCMADGFIGYAHIARNIPVQIKSDISFTANVGRQVLLGPVKNAIYSFPQALVQHLYAKKLVEVEDQTIFDNVAILAVFNSGTQWYYSGSSNQKFAAPLVDFEQAVLHEILHGLGFGASSFSLPIKDVADNLLNQLIPSLTNIGTKNRNFQFVAASWWDAFVVNSTGSQWLTSYEAFNEALRSDQSYAMFDFDKAQDLVLKDPVTGPIAADKYRTATTRGGLSFAIQPSNSSKDAVLIPLLTSFQSFKSGSSLSHIESPTPPGEFLMASSTNGKNLDGNVDIKKTHLESGIGPQAAQVLATLGYNIKGLPSPVDVKGTAVWYDAGLSGAQSSHPLGGLLAAIVFASLLI